MEVELKLLIRPRDVARLQRSSLLRDHASGRPQQRQLTTTYFDTASLTLHESGIAWRVRKAGRTWIQTLKGGGGAEGGLHQRAEWECLVAGPAPDLAALEKRLPKHHPWRAIARAAAARLMPVFVTDFRRTTWQLTFPDGTALEAALDQGEIRSGGRTEPICELELELKAGDARALFEFADALLDDVRVHPSNVSKAERGYRAFRPLAPVTLPALVVPRDAAASVALRAIAGHCVNLMQVHARGVAGGRDGESVHQMRVALRRLRAALDMFAPVVAFPAELRRDILWLRDQLALARDWGVLTGNTLGSAAAISPDQAGMAALQREARRITAGHFREAAAVVNSLRYARCLLRLGAWLCDVVAAGPVEQAMPPLGDFAGAAIARCRARMKKRAARARSGNAEDRHRLRIAVRRTRYALEFFGSRRAPAKAAARLAALVELQDVLGRLNDLAVGTRLLGELAATRPDLAEHAGFACGCFAAEARGLAAQLRKLVARAA